jgi:putative transposase
MTVQTVAQSPRLRTGTGGGQGHPHVPSRQNPQARESFAAAGEDLLRLFRLEVTNRLHRTLLSTNAIENVFRNLRRHLGRLCRWRENTDQADLWMASGLMLAQRGFRRGRGHEGFGQLTKALRRQEAQTA